MGFRTSCHDAFYGSLHWTSRSGELTYGKRVPSMGRKLNLVRIVISKAEWIPATNYDKMSVLATLEALGV